MKSQHLLSHIILKLAMPLIFVTHGISASSCSVNPTESVITVGEMASIDCIATGRSTFVDSWIQGNAIDDGTTIYRCPTYNPDGSARITEYLADGYFIPYKNFTRFTLQMNKTTLLQAGPYICMCDRTLWARANVGVVDFLPTFTPRPRKNINERHRVDLIVLNGDSVDFICSISFNGSANASFDIFINDSNGKTISNQSNLPFSIDKKSYEVNHSVIADPNVYQAFTCTAKVINGSSKSVIYSKTVNASLMWEPVSEVFISCSRMSCSSGDKLRCNANGRPRPTVFKWWKISENGKRNESLVKNDTEYLVLDEIGHFTYRCYTYNVIRKVTHEAFSSDFNIKVEKHTVNVAIIGAIIVGPLVFILVVVIFVIFFLCTRKRKHQSFISTTFVRNDSSNSEIHSYSKQKCAKQEISEPKQQGSSTSNKVDSEVVLCDNELYGAAKLHLDPSEMPVYTSIKKL